MDEEHFKNALEELKRADHLLFVSLKYTRTCDIMKHIVERLIASLDFMFLHILHRLKEQGKIHTIPSAPTAKAEFLKKFFKDDERLQDTSNFYLLLKRIDKAKFTRRQEYRRQVTMTAILDEEMFEINIDKIEEYFTKTKDFLGYVREVWP